MDPRRARDPRLARAQQRQASDSPAPSAIPPHFKPQPAPQPVDNDTPPSIPTPPQPFLQATSELDMIPGLDLPPQTYKQRPLFCVVCASNQVRPVLNTTLFCHLGFGIESVDGGPQRSLVGSRLQPFQQHLMKPQQGWLPSHFCRYRICCEAPWPFDRQAKYLFFRYALQRYL